MGSSPGMRQRGFHFRRQSPRKGFIVDFVCMKHQLVIEVDGGQHNCGVQYHRDLRRDGILASEGFRILQFWNSDIDRNLSGVLETIDSVLKEGSPHRPPPAATLPLRGRDNRGRAVSPMY